MFCKKSLPWALAKCTKSSFFSISPSSNIFQASNSLLVKGHRKFSSSFPDRKLGFLHLFSANLHAYFTNDDLLLISSSNLLTANVGLSDDQQMLRETALKFARDKMEPHGT